MAPRQITSAGACALLLGVLALGGAGCGAAANPDAVTFVEHHRLLALAVQRSVAEAERAFAALSRPPTPAQLAHLRAAAQSGRERLDEARASLPANEAPEEELPTAESEAGEGAQELDRAMGDLLLYAQHPGSASLSSFMLDAGSGRDKWNEAFREIYRLAGQSHPPLL